MTTYTVTACDGRTTVISAITISDAYQQATDFCGDDGLLSMV